MPFHVYKTMHVRKLYKWYDRIIVISNSDSYWLLGYDVIDPISLKVEPDLKLQADMLPGAPARSG